MKLRSQKPSRLTRRAFLGGAAGITVGLPWLEKLAPRAHAQAATTGPRRVIVVTYTMGVALGAWRPEGAGASMMLPYLTAPLEPFKERCLFVSAIDNPMLMVGGTAFAFGHPAKKESALTGTLVTGAFPSTNANRFDEVVPDSEPTGGANGPSVEHVIGEHLRDGHPAASVDLGVDGYGALFGIAEPTVPSAFSYESAGNPISLQVYPHMALDRLFANVQTSMSAPDPALVELRMRNASVLDAVRASFRELRQGLGRADRTRLDEHADRIRQLETDVQLSAACSVPSGIQGSGNYMGANLSQLAAPQIRILAHAMGCGMAPVGRLEFLNLEDIRFGVSSVDSLFGSEYGWHGLVHGEPLPGSTMNTRPGRDETVGVPYHQGLLDGYRFFVEQFAALLAELDSIPEGPDQTVLDNTLLILASDLGEGLGHGPFKMGYILAGNLGGARAGVHFDGGPDDAAFEVTSNYFYSSARYNVNQLLHSVLDMAGVVDAQGNPIEFGLTGFLDSRSDARRIDALFG